MSSYLQPGLTGKSETVVTQERTAQTVGSGLVPVFGTPSLIALLEEAAVNAVSAHLGAGETSVGVHLDVRHTAATPIGMGVRAQATLIQIDGRRLTFRVEAHDDVEQVAEGTHQRVIVDRNRFMQRAKAKGGG